MQKMRWTLMLLALGCALPVLASDGVFEINPTRAAAGGLTPGDGAGYPVTISEPGSYILTSNLTIPDTGTHGIVISADHVTLDLNGFCIFGPAVCTGLPGSINCTPGSGLGISSSNEDIAVMGGCISGMAAGGLSLGDGAMVANMRLSANGGSGVVVGSDSRVDDTRSTGNAGAGIEAGDDSLVTGSSAGSNNTYGLLLGAGAAYAGNVMDDNGSGSSSGGVRFDDNICDGDICSCLGTTEICDGLDNNCDGLIDEDWFHGGLYDTDENCGGCDIDCTEIYAIPNAYGLCDLGGPPTCSFNCCTIGDGNPACDGLHDYQDQNGLLADGCEFFVDNDAIYVATLNDGGIDGASCGTDQSTPCATIGYAMARATSEMRSKVLVAAGAYDEDVTLMNGLDLLGGHNPITWQRDWESNPTVIRGTAGSGHRKTVVANGILVATTFQGFTVQGARATTAGANSYGVWISNCDSDLSITDNRILAGGGALGANGTDGIDGSAGAIGSNGDDWISTGEYEYAQCVASGSTPGTGGGGGFRLCAGAAVSGGAGAGAECPNSYDQQPTGSSGLSAPGGGASGGGGEGGHDRLSSNCGTFGTGGYSATGLPGTDGSDGSPGSGGPGCASSAGSVSASEWSGGVGSGGADGNAGGGGGGGGAGGGADTTIDCAGEDDTLGGSGGGAGSGGCGGISGGGGTSGGGSFGIFVSFNVSSSDVPVITGNVVTPGDGGAGGSGGSGSTGGLGGVGGTGGTVGGDWGFAMGNGGAGGTGGVGGYGGGGGGACGGVSYGVYIHNFAVTPNYDSSNSFVPGGQGGSGGSGGVGLGNSGGAGNSGASGSANF